MNRPRSRRSFLKGLAAAAVVVGFDPLGRGWVSAAQAAPAGAIRVPGLDGALLTDAASLAAAADDFGHQISRTPQAVLKPGSYDDIARMVRFARRHGIKVAARGQGHATYGQAQVEAGVVIDMATLAAVHTVGPDGADVDAGATWRAVLEAALPRGLTPPVLTDYLDLSVGGTLAVGGIGGASHRAGVQIDNVLELTVVTGEGKLRRCSPSRDRALFEAALAGFGQSAIIVRATLRLAPAPQRARVFSLFYADLATFTEDQVALVADERFGYVEGQAVPDGAGGWRYFIEAASFYTPPAEPDAAALLAGLRHDQAATTVEDKSYFAHLARLDPTVAFLKQIGVWFLPHPWLDLFVPGSAAASYIGEVMGGLTLDDTGQGPVLIYPVKTARFTRPLFRAPDEPVVFLFAILRTAFSPAIAEQMAADNRALYDALSPLGGLRYPIDSVAFAPADWRAHFGPEWPRLAEAKRRFDPDNVLTPGQGMFV